MSLFPDAYTRALSTNLFTRDGNHNPEIDVEQIVPLVLARAGAEKRAVEGGLAGENALPTLIKIVEDGIAMVRQGKNACCYGPIIDSDDNTSLFFLLPASSAGDPRFRLEKFLSEFVRWFIGATRKLSEPLV